MWRTIPSRAIFRPSWEGKPRYNVSSPAHIYINTSHIIGCHFPRLYKLEYLYLNDNEFEGGVPSELGELTNLKEMSLQNNNLAGKVDDYICKLVDEMFLTQLTADCDGQVPELSCRCCTCQDRHI